MPQELVPMAVIDATSNSMYSTGCVQTPRIPVIGDTLEIYVRHYDGTTNPKHVKVQLVVNKVVFSQVVDEFKTLTRVYGFFLPLSR